MKIFNKSLVVFFLITMSTSTVFAQNDSSRNFFIVQEMINNVQKDKKAFYLVMLTQYYVEGRPYHATTLNVSQDHTIDITQTDDGFEAFVIFPTDIVHEEAIRKGEVKGKLVKVKLKVYLSDIISVMGPIDR